MIQHLIFKERDIKLYRYNIKLANIEDISSLLSYNWDDISEHICFG